MCALGMVQERHTQISVCELEFGPGWHSRSSTKMESRGSCTLATMLVVARKPLERLVCHQIEAVLLVEWREKCKLAANQRRKLTIALNAELARSMVDTFANCLLGAERGRMTRVLGYYLRPWQRTCGRRFGWGKTAILAKSRGLSGHRRQS